MAQMTQAVSMKAALMTGEVRKKVELMTVALMIAEAQKILVVQTKQMDRMKVVQTTGEVLKIPGLLMIEGVLMIAVVQMTAVAQTKSAQMKPVQTTGVVLKTRELWMIEEAQRTAVLTKRAQRTVALTSQVQRTLEWRRGDQRMVGQKKRSLLRWSTLAMSLTQQTKVEPDLMALKRPGLRKAALMTGEVLKMAVLMILEMRTLVLMTQELRIVVVGP